MKYLLSIISALLITVIVMVLLDLSDKPLDLKLRRYKKIISSRSAVGCCLACGMGVLLCNLIHWGNIPTIQLLLDNLILGEMAFFAVTDYIKHLIPNRFVAGFLLLWAAVCSIPVISNTEEGISLLISSLTGGVIAGLAFLLCYLVSRKQVGAGDVKMAFLLGLYVTGRNIFSCILTGLVICLVYSVIQMIRKKATIHTGVALAPFLYAGTIVTLLLG